MATEAPLPPRASRNRRLGGLAAGLVVLAWASSPVHGAVVCTASDLCAPGPGTCTISGSSDVGPDCVLDFGDRPIVLAGTLVAQRSGGSFSVMARDLTLDGGSLQATGTSHDRGGSITVVVTGAFTMAPLGPRINVNGEAAGGDFTVVASTIDVAAGAPAITARGTDIEAPGGSVSFDATSTLRVAGSMEIKGGGDADGGSVTLTAARITVEKPIDVSGGAGGGGSIDVVAGTQGFAMTTSGALQANGGTQDLSGGDGGDIDIDVEDGGAVLDLVQAEGAGPDGDGGTLAVEATGDVVLAGTTSMQGNGTESSGGDVDLAATGTLRLTATVNLQGGSQGTGGDIALSADTNLVVTSTAQVHANGGLGGGNVISYPPATATIDGSLEAKATSTAANGGLIDLGPHCTITLTGTLDARGASGGYGGPVRLATGTLTIPASGKVFATPCDVNGCGSITLTLLPGVIPQISPSATVTPPATTIPNAGFAPCCGNGRPDPFETCDDGNRLHCDGCSPTCFVEANPLCPPSGDPCIETTCRGGLGCVDEPISDEPCADDGNLCTRDVCRDGACTHPVDRCNDGIPCTHDACDPSLGCTSTPNDAACEDGSPCTTNVCDPVAGCTTTVLPDGTSCSDNDVCTIGDVCSGGACVHDGVVACDDGSPCTEDTCNPGVGCINAERHASCSCATGGVPWPAGTPCADGDDCTVGETCNGQGQCTGGHARSCDDGDPCTIDRCTIGFCLHDDGGCTPTCAGKPNGTPCSDGHACTAGTCSNGTCVSTPVACDDGDPCDGLEFCLDPFGLGCRHTLPPDGGSCDDGSACTIGDTCAGGVCVGGGASPCAPCESCDDARGCVLEPRATCRTSVDPTKNQLSIRDRTPSTSDVLAWKWLKGDGALADFGVPSPAGEALCIWDAGQQLIWRGVAPAGGDCGGQPCWKALGTKGYRYKDRDGTPSGISSLVLSSGFGGRAKIVLKGKGPLLLPPAPPLAVPLRVQLQSDAGKCWQADFSPAGVRANGSGVFKAKGG